VTNKRLSLLSVYFVSGFLALFSCSSLAAKQSVDLIVEADYLVLMDAEKSVISHGAVAIKQDQIIKVGLAKNLAQEFQAKQIISGKNRILMPGLINGHTHTAMTLFRGMADDMELMPWLNQYIFPMEAKFVDPEFIKIGSQLACYEMIKGGTTSFVDMYFYPQVIAEQTVKCGLRGIIGAPMIDFPSPGFKGWDDSFAAAKKFIKNWQGKNPRITPAFAPHAPYTVMPQHIKQVAEAARKLSAPVTIHLAETEAELAIIKQKYQTSPISLMDRETLLSGNQIIAAHVVHPSQAEIKLMAEKGVGVVHNPTSNLKLAAGIAPVPQMIKLGIAVGIGTDGAASNNDLDLWEDIRLAALIHKNQQKDPKAIPAYTALQMATSQGAKAIGLGDKVGQIKVGMQADLIQISIESLRVQPVFNVISHLVYVMDSEDVVTSIVAGKVLMLDGKVLTIDSKQLAKDVKVKSEQIRRALKEKGK